MGDPTNRDDAGTNDERDREPSEASVEAPATPVPPARRFPSSNIGRPRIEGVEAGVAAGLVAPPEAGEPERQTPSTGPRHLASSDRFFEEAIPAEIAEGVELPDWTDPPTREVPRVLLRPGQPTGPVIPGPVWRESEQDFEQDREAFAEMVSDSVAVVEHDLATDDDGFGVENFEHLGRVPAEPEGPEPAIAGRKADIQARSDETTAFPAVTSNPARLGEAPASPGTGRPRSSGVVSFAGRVTRSGGQRTSATAHGSSEAAAPPARGGRNPVIATVTGLAIGGLALLCFLAGPATSLAIVALTLLLAAAECFQSLRKAHYQPATLLGLVAAPGFAVAAYLKGPTAIPLVTALAVIATTCWYLVGVTKRSVVANISATILGIGWVALLGSFAGLLLDPTAFPHHHGVAYLLAAVEVTVAYDVGGYGIGSWFGKHKLAPSISPNKTWEGLFGGSLAVLVVAIAITSQMHPWTLGRAVALGLVAAVLAPIGDLAESMIKRDLNVKDMGSLLPAHGGMLDRIDALLFVLPATYVIVRLFHG